MPTPSSSDAKQTTAIPPRSETSVTSVLATFALVLPIVYIALCLIGFGVSLAVESDLGIPHSSLYKGQTDLIDLSSNGISYLFSLIVKIISNPHLLFQLWHSNWLAAFSFSLVIGLTAFFVPTAFSHKQQQAAADSNKPRRGQRMWEKITACLRKAKATLRRKRWRAMLAIAWRAMLAIAIGVLTPPLSALLLLAIAMIVVAFALFTPVLIGFFSGSALICQDTHGAAIGCSPMVRTAKTSTPASPAQQIITVHLKDGKDIAGVYLLSTPSAVLIFQPQTRQAMAILAESIADMSFKLPPLSR